MQTQGPGGVPPPTLSYKEEITMLDLRRCAVCHGTDDLVEYPDVVLGVHTGRVTLYHVDCHELECRREDTVFELEEEDNS